MEKRIYYYDTDCGGVVYPDAIKPRLSSRGWRRVGIPSLKEPRVLTRAGLHYANYLKYLEEARTEFLEERDISVKELAAQGTLFVVARQEIDYKSPAFYGDILKINTRIADTSAVKIEFEYEIKNQSGKIICTARTVMVCVGTDFKPKTIPEKIREAIER